jgi:hypothetical protein
MIGALQRLGYEVIELRMFRGGWPGEHPGHPLARPGAGRARLKALQVIGFAVQPVVLKERGDGGAEHVGSADLLELRGELLMIQSGAIAADRADELVGAAAGIAVAGRQRRRLIAGLGSSLVTGTIHLSRSTL